MPAKNCDTDYFSHILIIPVRGKILETGYRLSYFDHSCDWQNCETHYYDGDDHDGGGGEDDTHVDSGGDNDYRDGYGGEGNDYIYAGGDDDDDGYGDVDDGDDDDDDDCRIHTMTVSLHSASANSPHFVK